MASSSSGNATFVGCGETRLLFDAGLSRRELFTRLSAIGEDPHKLSAVIISHEHTDHVCGLIPILRKLRIPVYISRLTAPSIAWGEFIPCVETFQAGESFQVGSVEVGTFTIPHDAVDPVGFTVRADGVKIGIATDLGYLPDSVRFHLRGCTFLMLESNHDLEMLKVGPYPWSVKQRVMGRRGHLSNDVVCDFIRTELDGALDTLVLGHLSEHNNHPEIVRVGASQAIEARSLPTQLVVAEAKAASAVFTY